MRDGQSFRTPLPPQLLLLGAHLLRVLYALCADPELITSILPLYTIVLFTNVESHNQSASDMPVDRQEEGGGCSAARGSDLIIVFCLVGTDVLRTIGSRIIHVMPSKRHSCFQH